MMVDAGIKKNGWVRGIKVLLMDFNCSEIILF